MLLRTRITAMAAAALLLAALGWTGAGALREQLLEQRLSAAVRAAHAALWDQALAQQDRELSGLIDKLMLQPGLEAAVREADTARLQQLMARAGTLAAMPQTIELAALLASGRAPLLLHGQLPRELLDADSLERAVVGDAVDGLRVISAQQALVLATRRIAGTDAVLVLGRDARHALRGMAERTGAVVTLLDLRGRLLASTDAALGQLSAEHAVQRSAQRTELELGERSYLLSSSPVDDLAGHAAGTVLALLDHTPDARAHAFLGRLALGGTLALLLLLLLALNWYLRRSLRPWSAPSTRCRRWPRAMPMYACRRAATTRSAASRAPWPPSGATPRSWPPRAPCASACAGARSGCYAPGCRCWPRPRTSRCPGRAAAATKNSCASWPPSWASCPTG